IAHTCAMPEPICPKPTIPTRSMAMACVPPVGGRMGADSIPRCSIPSGQMPPVRMPDAVDISLTVNGQGATAHLPSQRSLLELLRGELGLTGTKLVCNAGNCGACTVLVDDRPVYSCITLAVACEGKRVETIEGISKDGALHPVQEAFIEHDAYQCGCCAPRRSGRRTTCGVRYPGISAAGALT